MIGPDTRNPPQRARWARADDCGATVIEYALIATLIGVAAVMAMFLARDALLSAFSQTVNAPGVTVCSPTDPNCSAYAVLDPQDLPSPSASGAVPPNVVTHPATNVGPDSAVLHADVNANGFPTSYVGMRWATNAGVFTTPTAGNGTVTTPPSVTGTADTAVSATVSGLVPNTTYYFRGTALNGGGWGLGLVVSFTTAAVLPTVTTEPATGVTASGAVLHATVNAHNAPTSSIELRYSTIKADVDAGGGDAAVPVPSQATGNSPTAIAATLTGLPPGTIYYYRATATNIAGTVSGDTLSFRTTAGCPVRPLTTITVPKGSSPYTVNVLSGVTGGIVTSVTPGTNPDGTVAITTPPSSSVIWDVQGANNKTWSGTYTYDADGCTGGTGSLTLNN